MAPTGEWKAELAAGSSLLLAATYACGSGVSALIYYSFGLFVQPLQQAFGWSRGEVSSTMLYGSVGLASPSSSVRCSRWISSRSRAASSKARSAAASLIRFSRSAIVAARLWPGAMS